MPNNMQMKPKRKEPRGFPVAKIFAEVKRRLLDSCGERVMDFFAMLPEHDEICEMMRRHRHDGIGYRRNYR